MTERIQKIIASRGVASRRKAEEMILAGRVTCNGRVCFLGESADPDVDTILLDGQSLPSACEYAYIMLHKPRGYVTTLSDEKGRRDITLLLSDCKHRVYPVGRLDMDSEGLLILTNDGEFANRLMHPKHEVNKTYRVYVKNFTPENLAKLDQPVTLDGYKIRKPYVKLISRDEQGNCLLEVVIHEGRNRQVRRMFEHFSYHVRNLNRDSVGFLTLGSLKRGEYRKLSDLEVRMIKNICKTNRKNNIIPDYKKK